MTAQAPIAYDAFIDLAADDSAVVGLVLKGFRPTKAWPPNAPTMTCTSSSPTATLLDADEAFQGAGEWLDAYANSVYRSIKNHRDGQALAARLDATAAIGFLLELLFTLDRRPRPHNKYLEWELTRFPLPGWDTGMLLDCLDRISGTGDVPAQRRLFARTETVARSAGHGAVLDAWGEDLHLMRP